MELNIDKDSILNNFNPHKPTMLMCKPDFFKIVGPDKSGKFFNDQSQLGWTIYQKDPQHFHEKALEQWHNLKDTLEKQCNIQILLLDPRESLSDQCFTADASLSLVDKFNHTTFISCFTHPLRQVEAQYHHATLLSAFPETRFIPFDSSFEGAGDNVYDPFRDIFWSGYTPVKGQPAEGRSDQKSHQKLAKETGVKVISVQVKRPFFHVDTCLASLNSGHLIAYPEGMSHDSFQRVIKEGLTAFNLSAEQYLIEVTKEEAMKYACNIIHLDKKIIIPKCGNRLPDLLTKLGFEVFEVDLSYFIYAGGGPHCLINYVNQHRVRRDSHD